MHQFKIVHLFFILCWCYSSIKCYEKAPYNSRNILKRSSDASLQCNQYANDLDILSHFPFTVGLDYKQQGPDKSTAILDSDNSTVVMIQLRQAGGLVPESVFCLKNLQALDIMNMFFMNGIVPDTLSNLQQLHTLGMTNTPITKMTEKLGSLQKLQSLTLDKCSLSQLPSLSGLFNLSRLSLPNNRLSKLEGLIQVQSLSLYKNLFTEIPTLAVPEALRRLDMNFNPVIEMSIVTSFTNLTEIRLSETQISVVPPEIDELERLFFLDLTHTQITHIPRTILKMPSLQYLVIQRNAFPQEEVDSIKMELINQQSKITLLI
jgi:Leucine-rich repeat (LRR) protein